MTLLRDYSPGGKLDMNVEIGKPRKEKGLTTYVDSYYWMMLQSQSWWSFDRTF